MKVVAGSTTTVYLAGLWEETSAGATKAYYTFGGQVVAVRDSTDLADPVSYLHGDHLGSVSVASGAGASNKGSQRFDPWGKVLSGGITQTRKNYTGQYLDTTGLLYYNARYYDPTLARFISPDTQAPKLANPQDLNHYSYVGNNPVTRNDPTGHDWEHFVQFAIGVGEGALNTVVGAVQMSTPQGAMQAGAEVGAAIGSDPAGFVQGVKDWGANIVRGAEFARNDPSGAVAALYEDSRGLGRVMGTAAATAAMAAVGPKGEPCSFSADTLVATGSGEQPIDTLQVGDQVLAYNPATGATGDYTVIAVLAHRDPTLLYVTIDSERIETTPEHPFYVLLRGWVAAGALLPGDQVRTAEGSYGSVQAVVVENHPQVMYNLTVAKAHTFFVGEQRWLVHNTCQGPFSIIDWKDYPTASGVPKPQGPFTVLEGADYEAARKAADSANRALHRANPQWRGMDIHEVQPVKFGGSPTDPANKVALPRSVHIQYTNWWNDVLKRLGY